MDQPLPTRPQLELAWEFIASFTGSAYDEGQTVSLKDRDDSWIEADERVLHEMFERWLRERRDEIIDYMIESDCAVETMGETKLDEAGCQRWTKGIAHAGPHEWDLVIDGETKDVFICPGLKAAPSTQIGGAHKVWPPRPGLPSEPVVMTGLVSSEPTPPPVSTHRNTQMLRDMGHDV